MDRFIFFTFIYIKFKIITYPCPSGRFQFSKLLFPFQNIGYIIAIETTK